MEKLVLNEMEAIQLTIEHGYDGEELESAKFKKLGCLDGQRDKVTGEFKNRAMIKFIRKLETIYEHVEVEGKGKKRTYTLSSKRDVMTEIQDNRVNNGWTDDDFVMVKHFFNVIQDESFDLSKARSNYEWAISIGAINPHMMSSDDVKVLLCDKFYYGADVGEIYKAFIKYIKTRNRQVGINCINKLKQWGNISTTEFPRGLNFKNEVVEITDDVYAQFNKAFTQILERYELTRFNYEEKLGAKEIDEKYQGAIVDIHNLQQQFKLRKVWKAIQIHVVKDEHFPITRSQFLESYYNKMFDSLEKYKRKNVKVYSFKDVCFNFNIAYLVNKKFYAEYERIEQYIKKHEPTEFVVSYTMYEKGEHNKEIPKAYIELMKEEYNSEVPTNPEIKSSFGDNVNDNEDKPPEQSSKITETFDISKMTIDDYISDIEIEDVELEPYTPETYKFIPKDNIHNNKQLANAVDMIRLAFSVPMSQPIAVGSF